MPVPNAMAQAWIDALRSGKYAQTTNGYLRSNVLNADGTPAGFCCLGVALDLTYPDGWTKADEEDFFRHPNAEPPFGKHNLLGYEILSASFYAQLMPPNSSLLQIELAEANDKGTTFAELADMIEKEWESVDAQNP